MKFKTELHCHSARVSACGTMTDEELLEKYIADGYTTVVLTNHLSRFTFGADKKAPYRGGEDWQEKLDHYFAGIEALRKAASGRIHVLWGTEICLNGTRSDYLVHGLDKDFYRAHPDLLDIDVKTLSARVREAGGLFYQAHPFRNHISVTPPELLDGIEVYNGHPGHDSRNDIAAAWAEKFSLRAICGSDLHHLEHNPNTAILTDEPITSQQQLLEILREGNYTLEVKQ